MNYYFRAIYTEIQDWKDLYQDWGKVKLPLYSSFYCEFGNLSFMYLLQK